MEESVGGGGGGWGGAEGGGRAIGVCRRDGERERGWLWKLVLIRGQ